MNINLTKLKIYDSIDKSEFKKNAAGQDLLDGFGNKILNYSILNIKKEIADFIYQSCAGIAYHSLALKIFNSENEIDLNDEELELFKSIADKLTLRIADAINEQIKMGTTK